MSIRLDSNLGSVAYDNLINSIYPPADVFGVTLKAGQGILLRGSLLTSDDEREIMSAASTGTANCILADDADTGDDEAAGAPVMGTAYRTGHFNAGSLITSGGYEITDADKEALRDVGILLSDAIN